MADKWEGFVGPVGNRVVYKDQVGGEEGSQSPKNWAVASEKLHV